MAVLYATSPNVDETVREDGEVGEEGGLKAKEVIAWACLEAGLTGDVAKMGYCASGSGGAVSINFSA